MYFYMWSTICLSILIKYYMAATYIFTPDHEDPEYTDVCYEIGREMCDFCCMRDFEMCSRDIGICEPVEFRGLHMVLHVVYVFAGILCGIPIIIRFMRFCLTVRCCIPMYPTTVGVTLFELLARITCYVFRCLKFSDKLRKEEDILGDDEEAPEKHGFIYYMFCCCLCAKKP